MTAVVWVTGRRRSRRRRTRRWRVEEGPARRRRPAARRRSRRRGRRGGRQAGVRVGRLHRCHTLADAGSTGTVGPNLDEAKPPPSLVVDRVTNGKGAMPPFEGQLTEKQIQDVAAYVSSVAGTS